MPLPRLKYSYSIFKRFWLIYHLEQAALATGIPLLVQCVVRQIADACMNAQGNEEEEKMLDLILRLQAIGEKYHLSIPPFPQTGGPIRVQGYWDS